MMAYQVKENKKRKGTFVKILWDLQVLFCFLFNKPMYINELMNCVIEFLKNKRDFFTRHTHTHIYAKTDHIRQKM